MSIDLLGSLSDPEANQTKACSQKTRDEGKAVALTVGAGFAVTGAAADRAGGSLGCGWSAHPHAETIRSRTTTRVLMELMLVRTARRQGELAIEGSIG